MIRFVESQTLIGEGKKYAIIVCVNLDAKIIQAPVRHNAIIINAGNT